MPLGGNVGLATLHDASGAAERAGASGSGGLRSVTSGITVQNDRRDPSKAGAAFEGPNAPTQGALTPARREQDANRHDGVPAACSPHTGSAAGKGGNTRLPPVMPPAGATPGTAAAAAASAPLRNPAANLPEARDSPAQPPPATPSAPADTAQPRAERQQDRPQPVIAGCQSSERQASASGPAERVSRCAAAAFPPPGDPVAPPVPPAADADADASDATSVDGMAAAPAAELDGLRLVDVDMSLLPAVVWLLRSAGQLGGTVPTVLIQPSPAGAPLLPPPPSPGFVRTLYQLPDGRVLSGSEVESGAGASVARAAATAAEVAVAAAGAGKQASEGRGGSAPRPAQGGSAAARRRSSEGSEGGGLAAAESAPRGRPSGEGAEGRIGGGAQGPRPVHLPNGLVLTPLRTSPLPSPPL